MAASAHLAEAIFLRSGRSAGFLTLGRDENHFSSRGVPVDYLT